MGNIATNTSDQIQRLKDRGMIMDYDDAKVKEILLDIGYYRLGFYWHPFEINNNHDFHRGTKFSDAVTLYYLDVDLRNLLLKYINRIEINFRTKLVYYVSNKYKNSPAWFVDPKVMTNNYVANFNDYYNSDFINNNKQIKNHDKKYGPYAPAWKTLEFFTFGSVLKTFKSLNDTDVKERISKEYGILNLNKFINLMDTIVFVRNTCAHGGVLFDFQTPKGIAVLPHVRFNNNNRHSLDSAIKIILCILDIISKTRKTELEESLNTLLRSHFDNENIKSIIETKIGYKH
jgi:abortive infection bacteriophage resistance protein